MTATVIDNRPSSRFEAWEGTQLAGFSEYIRTPELIVFTHTEVDAAFEGQGVGSQLARHGLEVARTEELKVMALCPFIAAWLTRHPQYSNLEYRNKETSAP